MLTSLFIVPARSGSKGVADKNIRPLGGVPLLAWTARVLQQAQLPYSSALLSTDSPHYAEIARAHGLSAPFLRPQNISNDTASAVEVAEHALNWYRHQHGQWPDLVFWLQPTSPFRGEDCLQRAWQALQDNQADAVVACMPIHRNLTTLFNDDSGFMRALDSTQPTQTARQQIRPLLTPNGALYACKSDWLLQQRNFYPPRTLPLPMNAVQSLDIDTELDWSMAEAFIRQGLI
jgi:CMP-N,N'-diacetyllegionaminic acid synthase